MTSRKDSWELITHSIPFLGRVETDWITGISRVSEWLTGLNPFILLSMSDSLASRSAMPTKFPWVICIYSVAPVDGAELDSGASIELPIYPYER